MWNSKWEYENQAYLKERYEKKMSGEIPYHPVRRFMVCVVIADIKRNCRRSGVKPDKNAFARSAARCLHLQGRTEFIVPTIADRKPTAKVLRIGKCSF